MGLRDASASKNVFFWMPSLKSLLEASDNPEEDRSPPIDIDAGVFNVARRDALGVGHHRQHCLRPDHQHLYLFLRSQPHLKEKRQTPSQSFYSAFVSFK